MKGNIFIIIFVLQIVNLISCSENITPPPQLIDQQKPGFCLTFDDTYITEWNAAIELLDTFDVHATFFVTQIYSLSNSKIELLQSFKEAGHEIGCHGWKHINAEEYLGDHSIEEYLNSEIYPSLELMEKHNIQIKSYSYPYGYNCDSLDNIMLEIFLGLRDVTEEQRKPLEKNIDEINEIFFPYEDKKFVAGLGIDKNFNISMNMIEDGFRRASEQNEVIVFYAHKPVIKANAPYQIEHEYLKEMFNLAKKYELKSYTFSELFE